MYIYIYIFAFLYHHFVQTSISIEFIVDVATGINYTLSYKQHPQQWNDATSIPLQMQGTNKIIAQAVDLLPATTYCLRVTAKDLASGQEVVSPELIVDTEAVGCTPGQKSCCIVQ